MMIRIMTVLIALSCLVVFVSATNSSGKTGTIEGRVTDKETGVPVAAAFVIVEGSWIGVQTDIDGRFTISNIETGAYDLKIAHPDYFPVTIADVTVRADQVTSTSAELERRVTDFDETTTTQRIDYAPVMPKAEIEASALKPTADGVVRMPVRCVPRRKLFEEPSGYYPPAHGGNAIVNGEPFDAMFFEHYGVNPFVDTEDDHLSTFAVDVDDASFIMTRSYLERGHLPPKDAVRTEEFINHFNYKYAAPDNKAFSILFEGAPSRFGADNVWLLRVGIKGLEIRPENRKPANLVFVVDVSGSMGREDRLGLVRKALRLLVDELTPQDQVGIVVYGSRGQVLLQPTSIRDKEKIIAGIEGLFPGGSTNAEEGIRLGYKMAGEMFERGKINRVILCSDGVANVGRTGPGDILREIKQYADRGITLSSIGFGMGNYNDILLEKLGNKGNGHYAYVDDLAEARRVFVDNLTGNLQVIARDVKIQIDFDPKVVRSYRLLGYENRDVDDDKFRDDTEDGGEVGSGHSVTALYELKFRGNEPGRDVGKMFIRFKDSVTGEVTEVSHEVTSDAFARQFERTTSGFKLAAAAAEFSEILRKSYWAKGSELSEVLNLATRVYGETEDPDVLELMSLISRANEYQKELAEK
jgi:Ca-activated chloride channel family protein